MNNKLLMKQPAGWWGSLWREALPCGNGPIGAAVYGAVHDETIMLTHEDLWHLVETPEMPDVSHLLPQVRRLLEDGMVNAADRMIVDELKRRGYKPDIGYPLPLGDLKIKMPVSKGFRHYRRELDMDTGEASVHWHDGGVDYMRRTFVSRSEDFIVTSIESSTENLEAQIRLELHNVADRMTMRAKNIPELPKNVHYRAEADGYLYYAAQNDDGEDFGAVGRVYTEHGELEVVDGKVLNVKNAQHILIVVKVFTKTPRLEGWQQARLDLVSADMNYQVLLKPHLKIHGDLFHRVKLNLGGDPESHNLSTEELLLRAYQGDTPTAMVEKMWSYGRYLLISSSREGGHPCHLYGNWCGEYRGFWAFNMANENLQMIYWQALTGSMPEIMLPVFDYYDGMMDDFRENAKKLYGCRGIYIPAVSTPPSGLMKTMSPHIIHWTGAAAWIGHKYYDYFLYTGDETFLRERALPFLRATVEFYEDFFYEGENGYFISAPSNSPENTPGNHWDGQGMGEAMETTINATMDFALAKEAITNLITGSEHLGIDNEEVKKWKGMLEKIPPYEINEDGAVKEWMHPDFTDNYHHRHQSHIYPLFPGREIHHDSDRELFQAFETAIDKRKVIGLGEQTGWSLAHMAHVYARLFDGEQALDCLNLLSRSCVKNNFFTTHNDWRGMGIGVEMEWAPFQIDANMGWTSAVQYMLLQSRPGVITVLPAIPRKWKKGGITGLMTRGRISVSMKWDRDLGKIDIVLLSHGQSQDITVRVPLSDKGKYEVSLEADMQKKLSVTLHE